MIIMNIYILTHLDCQTMLERARHLDNACQNLYETPHFPRC